MGYALRKRRYLHLPLDQTKEALLAGEGNGALHRVWRLVLRASLRVVALHRELVAEGVRAF